MGAIDSTYEGATLLTELQLAILDFSPAAQGRIGQDPSLLMADTAACQPRKLAYFAPDLAGSSATR